MSHGASVIVPSLTGDRLSLLLDSLAEQTIDHQVIVVDNGCPDGSVQRACERHPGVERLRFERNLGFSRAVNAGATRAEGDVLLMVNDDVVCDPTFVEPSSRRRSTRVPGSRWPLGCFATLQDPHLIETAVVATVGTARVLRAAGLEVEEVAKVADADAGEQTVVDLIHDRRCDLIVNTPQGSGARADGYRIREAALAARVPCMTTISGAAAAVHAIANARAETALSLQERIHHGGTNGSPMNPLLSAGDKS